VAEDAEQLTWIVERADALRGTAEMALESAAPMIDWTSMCHETQYTRLFRS